jgi:hypothetical protein
VRKEKVDVALALVKPEGFVGETIDGTEVYTAEIAYPKDRESLLLSWETMRRHNRRDFGFHYEPYNFDSNPEKSFFEQLLAHLDVHPGDVEDVYFTGALTDPQRTDFYVEYKDPKGKWRRYTPDFIIRKKPKRGGRPGTGKVLIVEIKREHDREHPVDGLNGRKAMAVRTWEKLDPERLRYEMIFTATDVVPGDRMKSVRDFAGERS